MRVYAFGGFLLHFLIACACCHNAANEFCRAWSKHANMQGDVQQSPHPVLAGWHPGEGVGDRSVAQLSDSVIDSASALMGIVDTETGYAKVCQFHNEICHGGSSFTVCFHCSTGGEAVRDSHV